MKPRLEEEEEDEHSSPMTMKMSFPQRRRGRRKLESRKLLSWIFLFPPTVEQMEVGP